MLAIPFTAMLDWAKQEIPVSIAQMTCEIARIRDGSEQAPRLDPGQPITVAVGEDLVCGIDQYGDGGDYVVWRGGGHGSLIFAGPTRAFQDLGTLEKIRARFKDSERSDKQSTACTSELVPFAEDTFPKCRHTFRFSTPGNHTIQVKIFKRGDNHVDEMVLPVRVDGFTSVLKLPRIQIIPPANARQEVRVIPLSETLNPPVPTFSNLGMQSNTSKAVKLIDLRSGEKVVNSSVNIQSSNSAQIRLEPKSDGLYAIVDLRARFAEGRAWINASVTATIQTFSPSPAIDVSPVLLRAPSLRQIHSQPVPEGSRVRLYYLTGLTEEVSLEEETKSTPSGRKLVFSRTATGVVVNVR